MKTSLIYELKLNMINGEACKLDINIICLTNKYVFIQSKNI